MTNQPEWKLIANLGDVNFADYGGMLVYVDTTGVYGPEGEFYFPKDEENGGEVYRVVLETGDEWWSEKLSEVAATCGQNESEYRADLASGDPVKIALVYRDLVGYFGGFEFDQYPIQLTEDEAQARYARVEVAA